MVHTIVIYSLIYLLYGCRGWDLRRRLDIGFVIDSALQQEEIEKAVGLIQNIIKHVSISPGTTRIALIESFSKPRLEFHYRKYSERDCLEQGIERFRKNYIKRTKDDDTRIQFETLRELIGKYQRSSTRNIAVFLVRPRWKVAKRAYRCTSRLQTECWVVAVGDGDKKMLSKRKKRLLTLQQSSDVKSILSRLRIGRNNFAMCKGDGKRIDECNRICHCSRGRLTNCYRLRKEFQSMSKKEQQRYIDAYIKLTTSDEYRERYEHFIHVHVKYFCWGIHKQNLFFPWHRWYIMEMENLLKEIDCRITLPYWDWSADSDDPWSPKRLWRNDTFGADGLRSRGYCVQNGPFREGAWKTPYFDNNLQIIEATIEQLKEDISNVVPYLGNCLRRGFHLKPPSALSVERALHIPFKYFNDFELHVRHNYHNEIHNVIGGTMCSHFAAAAPEFFLHHSFLDNIWYRWQKRGKKFKNYPYLDDETKMLGSRYKTNQFINSEDMPGCVRVKYSKTNTPKVEVKRSLDEVEMDDNDHVSPKFWDGILEATWVKSFPQCEASNVEKVRAQYLKLKLNLPPKQFDWKFLDAKDEYEEFEMYVLAQALNDDDDDE